MADREIPEINAGSMADIAFLLLVFFLVTTTIQSDSGVKVKLPAYIEEPPPPQDKNKRNIFAVQVNGNDALLVRGTRFNEVTDLKDKLKEFIMNRGKDPNSSDSPQLAVVSLLNDNATSYSMYVAVYDQIKSAYSELRDKLSNEKFGRNFEDLTEDQTLEVRAAIPMTISEAEPTSFEK